MRAYHSDLKLAETSKDRYLASCSLRGTEAIVAGLFKVVLNRPELHLDENLFTPDIESPQAIELVSRINRTFDTQLSLAALFAHPTAREMAALVAKVGE